MPGLHFTVLSDPVDREVAVLHFCLFNDSLSLHNYRDGVVCVRLLTDQSTVVASLAPRQIDRGDVQWHYWDATEAGKYRSCSCWKKECWSYFYFLSIVYHGI